MWHSPVAGRMAEGCRSDLGLATLRVFSAIKNTIASTRLKDTHIPHCWIPHFQVKVLSLMYKSEALWINKTNHNHSSSESTVLTLTGSLGPIFRPTKGPGMFEKPGVAHLQMWDEEMRGRIAQSCPPSPRFLPSWQHSCRARGSVSAVLQRRIRNRQKEAMSEVEKCQGCSWELWLALIKLRWDQTVIDIWKIGSASITSRIIFLKINK